MCIAISLWVCVCVCVVSLFCLWEWSNCVKWNIRGKSKKHNCTSKSGPCRPGLCCNELKFACIFHSLSGWAAEAETTSPGDKTLYWKARSWREKTPANNCWGWRGEVETEEGIRPGRPSLLVRLADLVNRHEYLIPPFETSFLSKLFQPALLEEQQQRPILCWLIMKYSLLYLTYEHFPRLSHSSRH